MKSELYRSPKSTTLFISTREDALKLAASLLKMGSANDLEGVYPVGCIMAKHVKQDGKSITAAVSVRVNHKR